MDNVSQYTFEISYKLLTSHSCRSWTLFRPKLHTNLNKLFKFDLIFFLSLNLQKFIVIFFPFSKTTSLQLNFSRLTMNILQFTGCIFLYQYFDNNNKWCILHLDKEQIILIAYSKTQKLPTILKLIEEQLKCYFFFWMKFDSFGNYFSNMYIFPVGIIMYDLWNNVLKKSPKLKWKIVLSRIRLIYDRVFLLTLFHIYLA